MPNLSQGRAPPTAVILEPKNSEPGSTSEKGESYDRHVRRARQKQKHNNRRSGGGSRCDHLPLRGGLFVRNNLRRHIHPSFHRGRLSWLPRPCGGGAPPSATDFLTASWFAKSRPCAY